MSPTAAPACRRVGRRIRHDSSSCRRWCSIYGRDAGDVWPAPLAMARRPEHRVASTRRCLEHSASGVPRPLPPWRHGEPHFTQTHLAMAPQRRTPYPEGVRRDLHLTKHIEHISKNEDYTQLPPNGVRAEGRGRLAAQDAEGQQTAGLQAEELAPNELETAGVARGHRACAAWRLYRARVAGCAHRKERRGGGEQFNELQGRPSALAGTRATLLDSKQVDGARANAA